MVSLKIKLNQNLTEQKIEIDGVDISAGVISVGIDGSVHEQPRVILTLCPENIDIDVDTVVEKINHVRLKKAQELEVAEDF